MAIQETIMELNDTQIDAMINLLQPLDNQIDKRVNYVMKNLNMPKNQALEYIVTDNPVLWAKVYLDWEARDYQFAILTECKKSKKLVLRLGRRLGKTDDMCVAILWFAYTQYNKGPNNQYDIIIATPYETQIDLIFKRLHQLLEISPLLKSRVSRDVHHNLCFNINLLFGTLFKIMLQSSSILSVILAKLLKQPKVIYPLRLKDDSVILGYLPFK